MFYPNIFLYLCKKCVFSWAIKPPVGRRILSEAIMTSLRSELVGTLPLARQLTPCPVQCPLQQRLDCTKYYAERNFTSSVLWHSGTVFILCSLSWRPELVVIPSHKWTRKNEVYCFSNIISWNKWKRIREQKVRNFQYILFCLWSSFSFSDMSSFVLDR